MRMPAIIMLRASNDAGQSFQNCDSGYLMRVSLFGPIGLEMSLWAGISPKDGKQNAIRGVRGKTA